MIMYKENMKGSQKGLADRHARRRAGERERTLIDLEMTSFSYN